MTSLQSRQSRRSICTLRANSRASNIIRFLLLILLRVSIFGRSSANRKSCNCERCIRSYTWLRQQCSRTMLGARNIRALPRHGPPLCTHKQQYPPSPLVLSWRSFSRGLRREARTFIYARPWNQFRPCFVRCNEHQRQRDNKTLVFWKSEEFADSES